MVGKIDIHSHACPDFFGKTLKSLGHEVTGVPPIPWSLETTNQMMAKLDISTSILSLSSPGPDIVPDIEGARSLARQYNEWAAEVTKASPSKYGFFAAVPGLADVDGCLAEIRHALNDLQADGVCLFTSYGGKYLGDPAFELIWQELNDRAAVVFVHPTIAKGYQSPSALLQPPAFDFPHETGRAAAHMVMTGTKRRYPDCKIILAHGGGDLPFLSERLAQLESGLFAGTLEPSSPKTYEEIMRDAKSFYFDLALAGTANVLDSLLKWAPGGHVLYGSDYPFALGEAEFNTANMEEYEMEAGDRERYYAGNCLDLLPRLRQ